MLAPRRFLASRRLLGAATLVSALALTQLGSTGSAEPARILPAVCDATARPWLLDRSVASPVAPVANADDLVFVTWNIHSGLGDGLFALAPTRASVERNLREIAADVAAAAPASHAPVAIALNEVDFGSRRSAWIDEADFLAEQLRLRTGRRYEVLRGITWQRETFGREVRFGNALLVGAPVVSTTACLLGDHACEGVPGVEGLPAIRSSGLARLLFEDRGVLKATLSIQDRLVDVIVTHLDAFSSSAREAQAAQVLRRFVDPSRTTVLLGDLNAVPTVLTGARRFFSADRTLDVLTSDSLADARVSLASIRGLDSIDHWSTHPASAPKWALDAILASVDLVPQDVAVIGGTASDHRGLAARLRPVSDSELADRRRDHDVLRTRQRDRILHCDLSTDEARRERGWLLEKTGFLGLDAPAS